MSNRPGFIGTLKLILYPAGLILLAAGCDRQDGPHAIHETEIKPGAGGGGMPMDAVHGFAGAQPMQQPMMQPQGDSPEIEFDAPDGWVFQPGSGMRLATFKIKDDGGEKEATIVALPSTADGYNINVKRWLGQLGMDLPDPRREKFIAEREAFSTVQNVPGALFDFTRLKDVPDQGKGYMLASMIDQGGRTIFVKLTGGTAFLKRNKQKFLALSKSIRMNADAAGANTDGGAAQSAAAPGETPAGSAPEAPMGQGGDMGGTPGGNMGAGMPAGMPGMGGPSMQSNDPAFNQMPSGVSRLTWQTPAGWKSLGAKGMRTASFSVAYQGKTADGSIVQLPGPAGGIESNVRRWMEQVGLAQLDDKAMQSFLESQKRIRTKDGYDGILVNLASVLNGNMTQENSILAVLIQAPHETIFVKLTGPRSVLLRNVDALSQLASSLAVAN